MNFATCLPARHFVRAGAVLLLLSLGACGEEDQAPTENNTYNVHLYYGKDVTEHKALGQVVGISECKTIVHTTAAQMALKPHSYTYECCWVKAGKACYQKHK